MKTGIKGMTRNYDEFIYGLRTNLVGFILFLIHWLQAMGMFVYVIGMILVLASNRGLLMKTIGLIGPFLLIGLFYILTIWVSTLYLFE